MKAGGLPQHGKAVRAASILIVVVAAATLAYVLHRQVERPTTDDAAIDAETIHVAAAVGGRIIAIPVEENAAVRRGDLLFAIDPAPYQFAAAQAQADLALAQAALETQRRVLSTQRSAAQVARDQISRAEANLDLSTRTVERLTPLAAAGYVPTQQLDQARTARRDALVSLRQAREQDKAAARAVDTEAGALAAVRAREAALDVARRALQDTTVRSPHDGRVVGLSVSSGEIAAPSQSLFTLVNTEAWFAVGNFRETELHKIAVGDCATVYSLIDRRHPIKGVVQGLGAGVFDAERVALPRNVPYVQRSLNWVRVAQRFPVRVKLEAPPSGLMRLGASAVIEIRHGAACR